MEIVHITKCEVGDVVRYKSSKKPYIIATSTSEGYFLFSKTQQYDSTINDFEVVRIIKEHGTLPERYEDEELNQLLNEVKNYLKSGKMPLSSITKKEKIGTQKNIEYPSHFIPNSSECILEIPKSLIYFERWNGSPLTDMFGKVTVSKNSEQMFAELAIMKLFNENGWKARWIEVYGRPNLNPIFLNDWRNDKYKNQIHHPIEDENINKILSEIALHNNNSYAGCWDVLGWKDDTLLFVEAKWTKKDKIRKTQINWLNAGLKCGLEPKNFLIVEWDFI